jgi:hypothetical protein
LFARRRPLLRAAAVGGGAYAMGRMSERRSAEEADQDPQGQGQPQVPAQSQAMDQAGDSPPAARSAEPSIPDQLTQLSRLHEQGALNDAEFASAKARLLGAG